MFAVFYVSKADGSYSFSPSEPMALELARNVAEHVNRDQREASFKAEVREVPASWNRDAWWEAEQLKKQVVASMAQHARNPSSPPTRIELPDGNWIEVG